MFWDNFERICREAGTTPSRACVEVDIGQNRPSNWKKSGTLPKQDELEVLAKHLGCTVADFFKDDEARENDTFSRLFTKKFSDMDEETLERGRQLVLLTFANSALEDESLREKLSQYRNRLAHGGGFKVTYNDDDDIPEEQEMLPIDFGTENETPDLDDYERDFIRIYEALDPKTRIKLMNAVYEFDTEGDEE